MQKARRQKTRVRVPIMLSARMQIHMVIQAHLENDPQNSFMKGLGMGKV